MSRITEVEGEGLASVGSVAELLLNMQAGGSEAVKEVMGCGEWGPELGCCLLRPPGRQKPSSLKVAGPLGLKDSHQGWGRAGWRFLKVLPPCPPATRQWGAGGWVAPCCPCFTFRDMGAVVNGAESTADVWCCHSKV